MKKIQLLAIAGLLVVSSACATTIRESFATNPALDGWQVFGNTNLFQWDPTNHVLDVTWDSSQTNSYFYRPLGRTYTKADSFCVLFDLQLTDATAAGYGNEVAIGLLHYSDATSPDFNRANGPLPNLFEFDYTPAINYMGFSEPETLQATLKDAQPGYNGFYWTVAYAPLNPSVTYRVELIHRAGETIIHGTVYTNGQVSASLSIANGSGTVEDFQLDTLSVSGFQDDGYGDTLLAHGKVAGLAFASPLPVGLIQTPAPGQVRFGSDTNWLYTLEQSADLENWGAAATAVLGNGTNLLLQATNLPAGHAFYRVSAGLP
jgi:hypothetical protein